MERSIESRSADPNRFVSGFKGPDILRTDASKFSAITAIRQELSTENVLTKLRRKI
jgi:hypothetical protein